jgi:hypothetical protein
MGIRSACRIIIGTMILVRTMRTAGCGSQWDNRQTPPVASSSRIPLGSTTCTAMCSSGLLSGAPNFEPEAPPSDGSAVGKFRECRYRVLRGGSWDDDPWKLRAAMRLRATSDNRSHFFGFRVARSLTP